MTSMTWTAAPAGYLGLGRADVCPHIDPRPHTVQGTAVPFGGDRKVAVPAGVERLVQDVRFSNSIAPNDGTTLGIHSSRRPPS
jgi:hypothetical protein